MTQIVLMLVLMAVAIVLLSLERVALEVVALGILSVLLVTGILTPAEALAGFSSEAVIVIGGLFVLTAGLRLSGALDVLVRRIQRGRGGPWRSPVVLLVAVAFASAFISNTTCTALFLPLGVAWARGQGIAPSRVLMPLAFASILGGSITLFGTSTNLIVSGLLDQHAERPLGFLELAPVALPVAAAGLLFLGVASRWLLPERSEEGTIPSRDHPYLAELVLPADSPLVGKTVSGAEIGRRHDLALLVIERGEERLTAEPGEELQTGDRLILEGSLDNLLRFGALGGRAVAAGGGSGEGARLVETVVLPSSELVGRTLREVGFRQSFGASVVALHRHGEPLAERLGDLAIRVGDVLLLHGTERAIAQLLSRRGLLLLSHRPESGRPPASGWVAPATFGFVVVAAVTGLLGLAGAVVVGCLVLFASRCLTPQEAYVAVEWRLLVLIAGMLAFGQALEKTGAAELLASALVEVTGGAGPRAVLAVFYLLTLVLTQLMSNQAAALVVLPVALEVAAETGMEPRALAIAVAMAASNSFLTPLEPSCLLVYAPGGYRFLDFPRLGIGLTLIAFAFVVVLVPLFWPLV